MTASLGETPQRPDDDAPPLEWARFYRVLGWVPVPIRCLDDLPEFADRLRKQHPEWTEEQIEVAAKAALKHPMIQWRRGRDWIAAPPTDAELAEWWGSHPERGIFLLTGTGAGLTVIDVDTYKGGDPSPWEMQATVIASTTRGGVHLLFAESAAKTVEGWPAEHVDIRGVKGGFVAPAGTGSTGRRFLRFELPLAPYPLPVQREVPAPPVPPANGGFSFRMRPEPAREGSFVDVVSTTRPDGTKNASAKEIVGMLCRPLALPPDALEAALGLLDGVTEQVRAAVRPGWRDALSAPKPRSKEFVAQFLCTWNDLRCDPPWDPAKVAEVAESLWRSSTTGQVSSAPSAPGGPSFVGQEETADSTGQGPRVPTGEDELAQRLAEFEARCPTGAAVYGQDKLDRNRHRKLLSCEVLPPVLDENGVLEDLPYGTGLGPWLNTAMGRGITRDFFALLVAKKAKAGKTAWVDQYLTGLTMLGAQAFDDAVNGRPRSSPIIVPLVISEMDSEELEERGLARYIGCDQDLFRCGDSAVAAAGVQRLAAKWKVSPEAVVDRIFARAAEVEREPSLFRIAKRLRRYVDPDNYGGVKGPALIDAVWPDMQLAQWQVARQAGVPLEDVWLVLFVDPVQRFVDGSQGDVPGVDAMMSRLRALAKKDKVIVLVTSDTNKSSASEGRGPDERLPPSAMVARATRGSYSLCHLPDAAMLLDALPVDPTERENQLKNHLEPERRALIYLGFSRWSIGSEDPFTFRYFPATGRFIPIEPPRVAVPDHDATPQTGDADGVATLSFKPRTQAATEARQRKREETRKS